MFSAPIYPRKLFAQIRNLCYTILACRIESRVSGGGPQRRERGAGIFLFFLPQPIEKSRFGRIKPSISKQFYLD